MSIRQKIRLILEAILYEWSLWINFDPTKEDVMSEATKNILDQVKTMEDARETITNLLEIVEDLQNNPETIEAPYQGTKIGFIL